MAQVEITTYIGDAKVEICCDVDDGCVERVVAYYKGKRHPKLTRWAEGYIGTTEGEGALIDACADDNVTLWDGRPW